MFSPSINNTRKRFFDRKTKTRKRSKSKNAYLGVRAYSSTTSFYSYRGKHRRTRGRQETRTVLDLQLEASKSAGQRDRLQRHRAVAYRRPLHNDDAFRFVRFDRRRVITASATPPAGRSAAPDTRMFSVAYARGRARDR